MFWLASAMFIIRILSAARKLFWGILVNSNQFPGPKVFRTQPVSFSREQIAGQATTRSTNRCPRKPISRVVFSSGWEEHPKVQMITNSRVKWIHYELDDHVTFKQNVSSPWWPRKSSENHFGRATDRLNHTSSILDTHPLLHFSSYLLTWHVWHPKMPKAWFDQSLFERAKMRGRMGWRRRKRRERERGSWFLHVF